VIPKLFLRNDWNEIKTYDDLLLLMINANWTDFYENELKKTRKELSVLSGDYPS
jgi:hypothetical protein